MPANVAAAAGAGVAGLTGAAGLAGAGGVGAAAGAAERQGEDQLSPVAVPSSLGVWEQFLAVRAGEIPNPCPPEVGLRTNLLYDAIRCSALENGKPVKC